MNIVNSAGPVRLLTDAFSESLGDNIKPKYRIISSDERFHNESGQTIREASYTPALLASGTCDIYSSHMGVKDWRLKKFDMPRLYVARDMVIINTAQKNAIKTLVDLAGKKAAVTHNSYQHAWLDQQNKLMYSDNPVTFNFYSDFTTLLAAIDDNQADFAILSSEDALWFTRHQLKQSMAAFSFGDTLEVGWGFHKQHKALQAAFTEWLSIQKEDQNSVWNTVWKDTFGLSFSKYLRLVAKIK